MKFNIRIGDHWRPIQVNDQYKDFGGQGLIWILRGRQSKDLYVMKIFKQQSTADKEKAKIFHFIDHTPPAIRPDVIRFCWPIHAVYDEAKAHFVGYIMRKAFEGSRNLVVLTGSPFLDIREEFPDDADWHVYDFKSSDGLRRRMKILYNWVAALHALHREREYVIGDIKPENVLATPEGRISIIDLDNCQIINSRGELMEISATTPNYFPPEGKALLKRREPLDYNVDSFAIGCCIYQILVGCHPYGNTIILPPKDEECCSIQDRIDSDLYFNGVNSPCVKTLPSGNNAHTNRQRLTPELCALFDRTFTRTIPRPTMREWRDALLGAINRNTIRP